MERKTLKDNVTVTKSNPAGDANKEPRTLHFDEVFYFNHIEACQCDACQSTAVMTIEIGFEIITNRKQKIKHQFCQLYYHSMFLFCVPDR